MCFLCVNMSLIGNVVKKKKRFIINFKLYNKKINLIFKNLRITYNNGREQN